MKVFVCLFAMIACAKASNHLLASAALSTGTSTSSRTQDAAGNYAFAYQEQGPTGGSSRSESGNGWGAQGSYSLNVGDGRKRIVKYVADGAGFRAAISTNEPGTAALPAAATSIASPYAPPAPVQPLPVAAPVPAVAVAAPINGWNSAPVEPALPALPALAPAPAPIAVAAPIANGWNSAPLAVAAPVAVAPAVSSYSTSINHVAPAVAAPVLSGWNSAPLVPAPAPVAAPVLSGWN